MKSLIFSLLGVFLALPAHGYRHINSLEEVVEIVGDMSPRETVVVLDLHETLAEAGSAAGLGTAAFMDELKARNIAPADRYAVWEEIHRTTPLAPMEPRTAEWVKKLQQKVPTIVLTAAPPRLIDRYDEQLREIGIDMSVHPGPFGGEMMLSAGSANMYLKKGIFARGEGCTKGDALKMLFTKRRAFPRNLIIVDNQRRHLRAVQKMHFRYGNGPANLQLLHFRSHSESKSLDWQLALAELQASLAQDTQSILHHCRKLMSFFSESAL